MGLSVRLQQGEVSKETPLYCFNFLLVFFFHSYTHTHTKIYGRPSSILSSNES